jgi:hypothetical protein
MTVLLFTILSQASFTAGVGGPLKGKGPKKAPSNVLNLSVQVLMQNGLTYSRWNSPSASKAGA